MYGRCELNACMHTSHLFFLFSILLTTEFVSGCLSPSKFLPRMSYFLLANIRPPCTGPFSHDTDVFKKQHRTNSKIPPSDPLSTSFPLLTNSFLNHKRRKAKRVGVENNISINKRVKVKREQLTLFPSSTLSGSLHLAS